MIFQGVTLFGVDTHLFRWFSENGLSKVSVYTHASIYLLAYSYMHIYIYS